MGRIDELVSAEFARWEQRGRGWRVWPEPVRPEPAFEEFTGYRFPESQLEQDDGRRPGFLASLFDSLDKKLNPRPPVLPQETVEPKPAASVRTVTDEFVASLPASLKVPDDTVNAFLDSLHGCTDPTAFELVGNHESVTLRFASSSNDAPVLQRQLNAFFPELPFVRSAQDSLALTWNENDGDGFIVDFGLAHEFMLPLQTKHSIDPFVDLVAVLNELQRDELAVFQVLLQPVQHPWPASIWRSVTDRDGKALFVNRPHLIPGTKEKLEAPLFGVVVRAAAKAPAFDRAAAVVRDMASGLRTFTRIERNRLIPLHNDGYEFQAHETDLVFRQSRRGGMLLNRDELRGFVHFPTDEVRAPKLRRQRTPTKAAPSIVLAPAGLLLGHNPHAGRTTPVHLSAEQRVRHMHVIGASGTGKSTLLFNVIRQDIERGEGIGLLDPHGDLVERILGIIPAARIEDVVLVDPSDEDFPVGFNILSAHSEFEKTLLASDLVSVFQRLSSSWGDQMGSVLNNAILAFLESERGGTLADLRRFLLEPAFRSEFLTSVRDPEVLYYWRTGFAQLSGNKSIGPILTRLEAFLGRKAIRYMVSQRVNRLDFAHILDTGKIFLAKLPQGQIGRENSFLLGSLLVSKFQQLAMSRQRLGESQRRDFWLYIDEFQNFITPSMAEILTGARKYRLGLVLAHQELRQLQRDSEVAGSVMSNPSTRIVFRVGDDDARKLSEGFASFAARDLQNLGTGEAIARVERSDFDFNLSVPLPSPTDSRLESEIRERVIAASRRKYGTLRAEVEAELFARQKQEEAPPPRPKRPAPSVPKDAEPAPMPKPAEDPKEPVPPKEEAPIAPEPTIGTMREPPVPRDLGRGGEQHKTIQERIQREAHALGFFAPKEDQLQKPSNEAADLVLKRDSITIAVEISITTTTDHEFGNVKKCLAAGFTRVAVVSPRRGSLQAIAEAVQAGLGPEAAAQVSYHTPDELIAELRKLAAEPVEAAQPGAPKERVTRGYKVRGHGPKLSEAERKPKEELAVKMMAQAMKPAP